MAGGDLRRNSLLLVCLLVLSTALPGVAQGAATEMDRPTWTVGDFWTYSFNYSINSEFMDLVMRGSTRMEVVGTESLTTDSGAYPYYRVALAINMSYGSVTVNLPGEAWFRASDLSPANVSLTMTMSIGDPPATTRMTFSYDPPLGIQWPLLAGKSWSATSLGISVTEMTGSPLWNETFTTTMPMTTDFLVEDSRKIAVPAGTFETFPVRTNTSDGIFASLIGMPLILPGDQLSFWSPKAGNFVRQESSDELSEQQMDFELVSYFYKKQGEIRLLGLPLFLWPIITFAAAVAISVPMLLRRMRAHPPEAVLPAQPPAGSSEEPPGRLLPPLPP